MNAIRIAGLRKTFNGIDYVVDGLDLEIPQGCLMVLIGFSGTGKSVLLKHMLGLLRPSEGYVEVLGENLSEKTDDELITFRQKFGVLFQNAALFDDATAFENVLFPLKEHRRHWPLDQMKQTAEHRLTQVGILQKDYDKLPDQLSGGMKKRVGLARALVLDPEVLFYDEPTTGLDPIMTEVVDNLIVETHQKKKGLTSVIVTHDLHAAFRIGDRVAMLDRGRIILQGTPQTFLDSDIELVRRFVSKGVHRT